MFHVKQCCKPVCTTDFKRKRATLYFKYRERTMRGRLLKQLHYMTIFTTFPLYSSAIAQSDHAYLPVAEASDSAVFIDKNTIETDSQISTAWVLWVYEPEKEINGSLVRNQLEQVRFDCADRTATLKYLVNYSSKGEVLQSGGTTYPVSSEPIVPDSFGEAIFKSACGDAVKSTSATADSVTTAVEITRSVLAEEAKKKLTQASRR
jgi:hypothetical protein